MTVPSHSPRQSQLLDVLTQLASAQTIERLVMILRGSAREIGAADGITIVRREGDRVRYVAEDAASPLWTGQDFPIESCVSGLAMLANRPILIPDIYQDARVPIAAYETTFVRSMAMFPIGIGEPRLAMGAYWATAGEIDPDSVVVLSSLARTASSAFDRIDAANRPPLRVEVA